MFTIVLETLSARQPRTFEEAAEIAKAKIAETRGNMNRSRMYPAPMKYHVFQHVGVVEELLAPNPPPRVVDFRNVPAEPGSEEEKSS